MCVCDFCPHTNLCVCVTSVLTQICVCVCVCDFCPHTNLCVCVCVCERARARHEIIHIYTRGYAMAQLVEELRYKLKGRGFDSRWDHWHVSLTLSFRPHYGPEVDSASNRNDFQGSLLGGAGGRCVGLTTLPPSCADFLKILEASNSCSPKGLSRPLNGVLLPLQTRTYTYL
jgi:hypothetical protein